MLTPDELEEKIKRFLVKIRLNEETVSTVLGALVVMIVGSLIFNFFRERESKPQITQEAAFTANFDVTDAEQLQEKTYVVQENDHLWKIAQDEMGDGNLWTEIARENNLSETDQLVTGQTLVIPAHEQVILGEQVEETFDVTNDTYIVAPGDSLRTIAFTQYGNEEEWVKLMELNGLSNPDQIEIGMELKLR